MVSIDQRKKKVLSGRGRKEKLEARKNRGKFE